MLTNLAQHFDARTTPFLININSCVTNEHPLTFFNQRKKREYIYLFSFLTLWVYLFKKNDWGVFLVHMMLFQRHHEIICVIETV